MKKRSGEPREVQKSGKTKKGGRGPGNDSLLVVCRCAHRRTCFQRRQQHQAQTHVLPFPTKVRNAYQINQNEFHGTYAEAGLFAAVISNGYLHPPIKSSKRFAIGDIKDEEGSLFPRAVVDVRTMCERVSVCDGVILDCLKEAKKEGREANDRCVYVPARRRKTHFGFGESPNHHLGPRNSPSPPDRPPS